jgi:hypothetical protein
VPRLLLPKMAATMDAVSVGAFVHAMDVPELLWYHWAVVFAGLGIGVGVVFELIQLTASPGKSSRVFTATNFWLIFSGVCHCWIEFNMTFFRGTSSLKPQMDMYAAADYRYGEYNGGNMEPGTAALEAITSLVVGPLCFVVAYAAAHELPCRHPLQLMLCTMQLYGLAWFMLQPLFSIEGFAAHFSSDPILFWVVAVGCNAPWAIIPPVLLYQSFTACCARGGRPSSLSSSSIKK